MGLVVKSQETDGIITFHKHVTCVCKKKQAAASAVKCREQVASVELFAVGSKLS